MASTLIQSFYEVAKEDLSPGIRDTLPTLDPLFQDIHNSWEGVERGDIGRPAFNASSASMYAATWVRRWTIRGSYGGAMRFTNPSLNLANQVGANTQTWNLSGSGGYPGPNDFVFPKMANPYVGLAEVRGTLATPIQLFEAEGLQSVTLDMGADMIASAAKLFAHNGAVCMFSRNPTWGEVFRSEVHVPGGTTDPHSTVVRASYNGGTNNAIQFTRNTATRSVSEVHGLSSEEAVNRIVPGMTVDIWEVWADIASTTSAAWKCRVLSSKGFRVDAVDFLNNGTVTCVVGDGTTAVSAPTAAGLATTDMLVYIVTLREAVRFAGLDPTDSGSETATAIAAVTSGTTAATVYATDDNTSVTASAYGQFIAQDIFDLVLKIGTGATATVAYGPNGLHDFIKFASNYGAIGDYYYYGVALSRFPQLLSGYKGSYVTLAALTGATFALGGNSGQGGLNDYITEGYLNQFLGHLFQRHGMDKYPDTVITTNGVLNGYFGNLLSSGRPTGGVAQFSTSSAAPPVLTYNQDRNSEKQMHADWSADTIRYRGKKVKIYDSPMARGKSMLFLKTRDNNMQRLLPPPIKGAGSMEQFRDVVFPREIVGDSAWGFVTSPTTGGITDFIDAPFRGVFQHFMYDVQGGWIRNITETQGV